MKKQDFIENLRNKGIDIDQNQLAKFDKYYQLLIEYNKKINLTAITEEEEVYGKHFYDSLLIMADTEIQGKVADVGSGAGFPGLPLKIMCPKMELSLIDPMGKRIEFLKVIINKLSLENVKLIKERAEDHAKIKREYYDLVVSRAVAPLAILSELCLPLCRLEGEFWALKGKGGREELLQAEAAIEILGGRLGMISEHQYDDQIRYNLQIEKSQRTPAQYPRNYARIKRHPL